MVSRPLPALTVEDLTAQLIWRVVGPLPWLRPRVHAALLWAGVSAEAPFVSDIGASASFGVTHEAVRKWLKPVRLAGPTVPLSEQQQLLRPSFPGDDHLARTRRAELFGLSRPKTLRELITPRWSNWIRLAEQILAAVGPLTLRQLHAGVSNARRRQHEQVPIDELGVAVLATGSIRFTSGGYDLAVEAAPLRRHADLVARARGHGVMSYTEATQIMKASGWSATSARQRVSDLLLPPADSPAWPVDAGRPHLTGSSMCRIAAGDGSVTNTSTHVAGPIGFGVVGAAGGDQGRAQLPQLAQRVVDLGDAVLEQLPGPSTRRLTAAAGGQDLRRRFQAQPQ